MKKYISSQILLWFLAGVIIFSAAFYLTFKPDLKNSLEIFKLVNLVLFTSAVFSITTTYGLKLPDSKLASFNEELKAEKIFTGGIGISFTVFILIILIQNLAMPNVKSKEIKKIAVAVKSNPKVIIFSKDVKKSLSGLSLPKSVVYEIDKNGKTKAFRDNIAVSIMGDFIGKTIKVSTLINPKNIVRWNESEWKFSIWDYFSAVDDIELSGLYSRGLKFATYWKIAFPTAVLGTLLILLSIFWKRHPAVKPSIVHQINFLILSLIFSVSINFLVVNLVKGIYSFVSIAVL